jgi:multidrug efflux pump subunit AcrA (membrane-fusion protein)
MKLNKKTAGAVIFIFLVLLLFLSRTIYSYNLPEVTGTKPTRGSLSKLEISSGIARWAETESVYAVSGGTAGRVYVKEGDYVEKDQVLFEMVFDVQAVERRVMEINNNIYKLDADIGSLKSRLSNIRNALKAASVDGSVNSMNTLSGQAGLIALEFSRAVTLAQNAQLSFELGMQSKNELLNAENNLKSLFYKYETEAEEVEHSIVIKQIEIDIQKLSRESILKTLSDYLDNTVVKAPAEGSVIELTVERGKFFPENALLVSIGVGDEFVVECSVSLDNNFVNPGDTCELSNASHVLKGNVRRVRPSAQGKTVLITVLSDEVSDGETFEVTFEKVSSASFTLVPNSAVNQDNDGYFIYQIKKRKGIMGEEYYVERLNIYIGDSDHQNTAAIRGIIFFEPIVLVSDKVLSAGLTVRLKNPENFFEN